MTIQSPSLHRLIRRIRLVGFDFDGVFTDNMVYVSQDGSEAVRCNRSDSLGLQILRQFGIEIIIISTESNPVVSARAQKLNMPCVQGCQDKLSVLKNCAEKTGLTLKETAFVGNDINDRECLTAVGLPIVVQDAHPDVVPLAVYQTKSPGGNGAVREICDLFKQALSNT